MGNGGGCWQDDKIPRDVRGGTLRSTLLVDDVDVVDKVAITSDKLDSASYLYLSPAVVIAVLSVPFSTYQLEMAYRR